jgi:uncharacterized protein
MSGENVEALRSVYEEWGRGNFRPRLDIYERDMEWGWSGEFPDLGGVVREPELRSERLRRWLGSWEEWRVEAEEYITSGEFVVVLTRYTGRGKESGVDVDVRGAHVWKMRDGKAVRLEVISSREKALEAAGLRE